MGTQPKQQPKQQTQPKPQPKQQTLQQHTQQQIQQNQQQSTTNTINRADVELSRGGPRCYLRFLIGGQLTKPIVLQLEHVSNPILSAQLTLFFSTKFYEGNAVIKTGSGESISCKSSRSQTDESKD